MIDEEEPVTDGLTSLREYQQAASDAIADRDATVEARIERLLLIGLDRFGADEAHLAMFEAEEWESRCSVGKSTLTEGIQPLIEHGYCSLLDTDRETVFIPDTAVAPTPEKAPDDAVGYYVGARLVVDGAEYGSLFFLGTTPTDREFDADDRRFLQHLSRYAETLLDHERRREQLADLHAATRQLMAADSRETVAERAVEAFVETLDLPVTGVWLYDEDQDVLEPVAWTEEAEALLGDPPTFDGSGSISWRAFQDGETRSHDDVSTVPNIYNEDTKLRSELVVPLGDRGIVNSGDMERGSFSEVTLKHAELLAENTTAALAQADRKQSLQAARDRFGAFFEADNDAAFVTTADEIVDCNGRTTELLGYDREELIGAPLELLHPGETERVRAVATEAFETGNARAEDITYTTADGQTVPSEARFSRVDIEGRTLLLVKIRDVSEQKQRERLNAVMNRVLRHNVRNEVNIVSGHASIAADATNDETVGAALDTIEARAETLRSLSEKARRIQDRAVDGLAGDQYRPTNLLERVAADVSRSHCVDMDIDPAEMERSVDGDLYSALRELCENAVAHADSDPHVRVTATPTDAGVRFVVTDDGPGLPEMEQKVFQTGEETPVSHGQGLGLWLVRWVVRDLGGSVDVVETGPSGSRIVVEVPTV